MAYETLNTHGQGTEASTRRGRQTRATIVRCAAELMYDRGVRATSVDDVLAGAGAGKSQLYHYFSTKDDLAAAVLEHQLAEVLDRTTSHRLDTWSGLRAWMDDLVDGQRRRGFRGCPVGALSSELSAASPQLAARVTGAFARWERVLAEPLERMRAKGALGRSCEPDVLASTLLAAVQGGYLLSAALRDVAPMEHALAMAYDHLRSHR